MSENNEIDEKVIGFILPDLRPKMFSFRIIKWVYRHRNLRRSLPLLKRNSLLIIKANTQRARFLRLTLNEYLRNTSAAYTATKSVVDEVLMNKISSNFLNGYVVVSSFSAQSIFLIPALVVYNSVDDKNFVKLHHVFGPLRLLFQCQRPTRMIFSAAMFYPSKVLVALLDMAFMDLFITDPNISIAKLKRVVLILLATLGELFGEPYGKHPIILPSKPMTFRVAKNSTCRVLNNFQTENYTYKERPIIFHLMLEGNLTFILEEILIPDISGCVVETSLNDFNKTTILEDRKILRIKSEAKAKRVRDSLIRILLF